MNFLMANENLKKVCTDEKLINDLVELYTYTFKKAHDVERGRTDISNDDAYELGKLDGAVNALTIIMTSVLGGRETYNLWKNVTEWAEKEKKKDGKK